MSENLLTWTTAVAAAEGGHHGPSFLGLAVYVAIVLAIVFGLMATAKKDFGNRIFKNPIAQCAEQLYLFIQNMCLGVIGSHGRRYIPMVFTFWIVIFISNLVSLFFETAPTADLGFNLGMALISIGYVQWEGMKANGVAGHWSHFAGPKLGLALIPITVMIFLIELVSEMMKNVSLSLRLFGNISGGHQAVTAMNDLGMGMFGETGIPFGFFLVPVKLLTCVVQAMVFSVLTCVYLSLVTGHHDDHEHADDHGHATPAAAH